MNKKVIIIIILVLLIAVIGAAAYFMLSSSTDKNPCAKYKQDSFNISRECILHMWKNVVGCTNSLASNQLAYYVQTTKPSTAPPVIINGITVAGSSNTLGRMTGDAKLWASLSTNNHREGCYGTDISKWPKNLLKTQADYEAYTEKVKGWVYTNVKSIGGFVKINPDVLDTERAGIIMGNYPEPIVGTGNSQLAMEIHVGRKPRLFINDFAVDWKVNDQIPLNTWAHVAFVLRDDKIEYYRDGVLKDTRIGAPPVLTRVPNIKYGYDNRPNSLQQVPNKIQVSNLLISQGANSVAWPSSFISDLFTKYKPVI